MLLVGGVVQLDTTGALEKFISEQTFRCDQLRCRMRPEICVARQAQPKGRDTGFGWGTKLQTPADKFCRSGDCKQGLKVARAHLKKRSRKR